MSEIDNLSVGQKQERKGLSPNKVVVVNINEQPANEHTKKPQLRLVCEHPESKQPIELNKVKFDRDGKLKAEGLWISLDAEGQLSYNSALAHLMRFYGIEKVKDLIGKQLDTVMISKEEQYLCFKAY